MLYKKNCDPHLSDDVFRNPGSEYRGAPFWAWNCELEKDELLWQLEVLKKMGLGGAHMHVRTGMATPYLSDAHMDLVKSCVEKCRQENMLAWLYDEDRWPSGAAGGIVTKEHRYRARHLLLTTSSNAGGTLLACYDICLNKDGYLTSGNKIDREQEAIGTKWYAFLQIQEPSPWYNNQAYINTLDKAAMQRFIEVTYERYLETVGDDFGGVVPAIFTDEPQFSQMQRLGFATEQKDVSIPWVNDIPETFAAAYGEDLIANLPELFWDLPGGQISRIRYLFHDHVAERFTEAFADQCGDWCEKHNLMLTGHMLHEESLHSQTMFLGDAMRSYRSFQLPGIDMLCNGFEFTTAKQAQSASHQYDREGVMSELYGVTGWDFDFRGHKLQGDWQAALGITLRVPHLSWVSMKGEAKRDYPASISYQSPWWEHYSLVEDHFARINTAMTRGKAQVRIGVIHPVESYWIHWGPTEQNAGICSQLDDSFHDLADWMLSGCLDFDYISESLLPQQCETGSAPLQVGHMAYDTILVPGCETLRSTTLERLEAFAAAGGNLIFLGDAPRYEDAVPSPRGRNLWSHSKQVTFQKEAVLAALEPVRLIDIRDETGARTDNLITQLRQDGDERWLFIAHNRLPYNPDVPQSQLVRISLAGKWSVQNYQTQTGEIISMPCQYGNGKTVVEARLYDLDSLLLHYTADVAAPVVEPISVTDSIRLPIPKTVRFTLSEPNVYLMDKAEFAMDDEPYRPEQELLRADNDLRLDMGWPTRRNHVAQPWVVAEPKPEHTARLRFHVFCATDIADVQMALEDADQATITCNGQSVPTVICGYFTDKSIQVVPIGQLHAGENILEVQLPFGRKTNIEWCYLLGQFGVRIYGEYRELVPLQDYLGFDSVIAQGLPHYGGNITYHIPVTTHGGDLRITVPHYSGTAIQARLDDQTGYIVYAPYTLTLTNIAPGDHTLELTLLGNRQNCFGPVHLANSQDRWIGPNAWRSTGTCWTESYRLKPLGIRSAPLVEEI